MDYQNVPSASGGVWALAARQHGVVSRPQLLELGLGPQAIKHRVAKGRLHRVAWGVYAVGRPQVTREGRWMAAVLACGDGAVLSHADAAALWRIRPDRLGPIEVSVPRRMRPRGERVVLHRRTALAPSDLTRRHGIPVTTVPCTLIDLAPRLSRNELEAAINEADTLDLTSPEKLRSALDACPPRPGVGPLRETLDRRTFRMTRSELERRFLPIVDKLGLPRPETRRWLNGFEVDFYWPDLGLVVETDGLRYHRTPAQQARDRLRDQAHLAAGLTPLRFTHAQIRYEPDHVAATLHAVAVRLRVAS